MKISFSLDPKSIQEAADELMEYSKKLRRAEFMIDQKLSQIAAEEAGKHFDGDVTVSALDHGVMATGESVVFQEFGAGSRISDPFPDGADVDFEIRRGAYSDLNGGEYAQTGYEYWHHNGERYEYQTPRNGLFYGMMAAKENAAEAVKEVLEEW